MDRSARWQLVAASRISTSSSAIEPDQRPHRVLAHLTQTGNRMIAERIIVVPKGCRSIVRSVQPASSSLIVVLPSLTPDRRPVERFQFVGDQPGVVRDQAVPVRP